MNWMELIRKEIDYTYQVTENLIDLVDNDKLDWKPATGENWMTVGQLLMQITDASGAPIKGFVTGDWGIPEEVLKEMKPEEMLPPAEKLPTVGSVEEAKKLLAEDKKSALQVLAQCTEERLSSEPAPAPWDESVMILGHRLLQMVKHLESHKTQLFFYLKLQGKPVNTGNLWGA